VARATDERRVLIIDADVAAVATSMDALRAAGMVAHSVADAESGLRTLAQLSPVVLVLDLEFPGKDGTWLLRRLRDEYMGNRPRVIVATRPGAVVSSVSDLGVDAVVLKPFLPETLRAACSDAAWTGERARESERLRELIRLTLLSGDAQEAFTVLARRLSLSFRTSDCVVVATVGDRQVVGVAHGPIDESPDAPIWDLCQVALYAGAPVLTEHQGKPCTYVAVPIESLGGTQLGVILLVDENARLISAELVDSLRALGQRLYGELAWRSVHERIAMDRDRLRESSMIDPVLNVWTRAALDQALPGEIAACQRRKEAMSVAVLNLRGLRHLNERYGHVVGDEALRHMAALTRGALRSQDLVARYGGDSLVVVLAGAHAAEARHVVERIAEQIAATPLEHGEHGISIQVVAGLSPLLGEDDSGEAAIARALTAVAAAKRRRETVVVVDSLEPGAAPAASPSLEPGTTLGGMYQVLHEISRGAMGVVYRAEDLGLGRPVALKTLRHDLARDRNFVERFRIEAATLAAIRHEHLVQVYSFGTDGEDVFFVMELVEGEPLEDRVELARHERKFISYPLCAQVIAQIGDALDAMHKAGVLHRDVKPANILLDRERERAVLVDVGIAKRRGTAHDPAGTPGFTAPESFVGGVEGPASDVYGLAATAYTLLTGNAPFGEGNIDGILQRQQQDGPTPPTRWRPEIPAPVEAVLVRALQPEPQNRYASASEFARAFMGSMRGGKDIASFADDPTGEWAMPSGITILESEADDELGTELSVEDLQTVETHLSPPPRSGARTPGTQVVSTVAPSAVPPPPRPSVPFKPPTIVGGATPPLPPGLPVAPPPRRPVALAAPAPPAGLRLPSLREPDAPPSGVPHTRGVLFRSAYRVLGARQGAAWVSHVSRRLPALAQALQPQNTLLSWHPTELFVQMLQAIRESGRDPRAFGRELGRVAASATFSRFFGADPAALSPGPVLDATDLIWKRYHTWGEVVIDRSNDVEAMVTLSGGPPEELIWAPTAGILEQVAVLAGASKTNVEILGKVDGREGSCRFRVTWTLARPAASG
jgi:diguanylate cyclase (GGDEF)-like protein